MLPQIDWTSIPLSVEFIAINANAFEAGLINLQGYAIEPDFNGKKFEGQRIFCRCQTGVAPDALLFKRGENEPTIFELA